MFLVKRVDDGRIYRVYGICGLLFLVWNDESQAGHWEWMPMELFKPEENVNAN